MQALTSRPPAWQEGLPAYIIAGLKRVGLSRRKYQETACVEALNLLTNGENAEINLPPGTGKTLIGQMIACVWIRERGPSEDKVLCILPSSVLREQHHWYCVWWAGESGLCKPLEITTEWIRSRRVWHQAQAEERDFWFALPTVFCNAVKSGHIPFSALRRIGLVLIDEYDAFSIGVLRAEGYGLRFSKPSERFFQMLGQRDRRYLLVSATPARNRAET